MEARFGSSIVIGFRQAPDVVDHAVLVEIEDGVLIDVQMAGPPSQLLDPDVVGEGIEISSIEAGQALREVADAWTAAVQRRWNNPGIAPTSGSCDAGSAKSSISNWISSWSPRARSTRAEG